MSDDADSGGKVKEVVLISSDPFSELEKTMASVALSLKLKYGLVREPSDSEISRWYEQTKTFIRRGYGQENAGHLAAELIFPSYKTRICASEADTISWLLDQAGDKDKP